MQEAIYAHLRIKELRRAAEQQRLAKLAQAEQRELSAQRKLILALMTRIGML